MNDGFPRDRLKTVFPSHVAFHFLSKRQRVLVFDLMPGLFFPESAKP